MRTALALAAITFIFASCEKKDVISCHFGDKLTYYYSEDYKESCAVLFDQPIADFDAVWMVFFEEDGYKLQAKENGEVFTELGKVEKQESGMTLLPDEGQVRTCTFPEDEKEFTMLVDCTDRDSEQITFIFKCVKDSKK